jgi:hypothetical protein
MIAPIQEEMEGKAMQAELLIRPGFNDHEAISDFLAPTYGIQQEPLFLRLVVEAQIAYRRPRFAEATSQAGIPLLIDPMTIVGAGAVRESDPWRGLPYAEAARLPNSIDALDRESLVRRVVEFELAQGATSVIPPYYYATSPSDAVFHLNLLLIRETAQFLETQGIDVQVFPLFCGRLQSFATDEAWGDGLGRFVALVRDLNTEMVGLCVSPVGDGRERVGKLLSMFRTMQRMAKELYVVGWRQGVYGPALVAAGATGYETGLATGEQCDIPAIVSRRRRERSKTSGGGGPGMFMEAFQRSLPISVSEILMADDQLRAQLMCVEAICCPDGLESTRDDKRGHALRSRSRQLRDLERQPHKRWRLYQVERSAYNAVTLAQQANQILEKTEMQARVQTNGMAALAEVARILREQVEGQQVA